jgi:hypothetical protein
LIEVGRQGNVLAMRRVVILIAVLIGTQVVPAAADGTSAPPPDYFSTHPETITVRAQRSRTRAQRLVIGSLLGGAGLFAGAAIYFHLDSRRIASDLSADTPQNQRWSDELDAKYDRGQLVGKLSITSYVVSAGLIAGAIVAIITTDPGTELVEIQGKPVKPTAQVVPGGATVGATWSW